MAPLRPKFYFLAPTTDSPVNGPISLGAIITHPREADSPLNNKPLTIDVKSIPVQSSEDTDYSVDFEKKRSFTLGIWASFLAEILGVGGDISNDLSKEDSEKWTIKTLKTLSFNPTQEYIKQSLEDSLVKDFVKANASWLRSSRVYMITGLKLAYGASAAITRAKSKGLNLHLGVDATSLGVPVEAGPDIGGERSNTVTQSFGEKTPFVLAFRMQKINVSASGEVKSQTVIGGMLGHDANATDSDETVPEMMVEGLEEGDTTAADFDIKKVWRVFDDSGHGEETCGCSRVES